MSEPKQSLNAKDVLNVNITDAAQTLQGLTEHGEALNKAADLIGSALLAGQKLLVCGNGGSAADASHIAAEIVGRFVEHRRGYAAIALGDSSGTLTAVGNDYGFDAVFARQVEAYGQSGDVLLAISTSGNSANVLAALEKAKELGLATVTLLGKDGGKARGLADVELIVRHDVTARIQEAHQVLYHSLCEAIDSCLCCE
jgi:D-sedoheptulose 7-phosphate isomerase